MKRSAVVLVALVLGANHASAQEPSTHVGLGLGVFDEYPTDFRGLGCEGAHGGFSAKIGRAVGAVGSLEVDLTWTGSVGTTECIIAFASSVRAPLQDGEQFTQERLGEHVEGETFVATRLAFVLSPWDLGPATPRVRLAGGRLLDKRMWTWTVAPGVRYDLGRHAVVLEAERWHFAFDVRRETWIARVPGPSDFVGAETVSRRPTSWLFRLGWEMAVGG